MEVIRIKKILARNWPIGICLHCVRTLSWFVPTMSTLILVYLERKIYIKDCQFRKLGSLIQCQKTNTFWFLGHSNLDWFFCTGRWGNITFKVNFTLWGNACLHENYNVFAISISDWPPHNFKVLYDEESIFCPQGLLLSWVSKL